jgi:dihydroorotate dehydrogenase
MYRLVRPLLFRLEAERAHRWLTTLWQVAAHLPGAVWLTAPLRYQHPVLRCTVAGIQFANPLGLAAGFDKDGHLIRPAAQLGFGLLELGTVTPRPQPGNPPPRLFRLPADRAVINRLGFNNRGAAHLADRLRATPRPVPLGVNIGKNRSTPVGAAAADYLACFRQMAPLADYIAVNVSSPNTPGLRDLQRAAALQNILRPLAAERQHMRQHGAAHVPPLFVKLSPDETPAALDAALEMIQQSNIDGIIATNTTTDRPARLRGAQRDEPGGLSGAPLAARATAITAYIYRATNGQLPIIGVGGIDSAATAYQRILAGASLLQVYTALVYSGPTLVGATLRGLAQRLAQDGWSRIGDAVGQEADQYRML